MARRIGVIGAGIIGCIVARELAAAFPSACIVVLERGLVGGGASRHSAGVHFPTGRSPGTRAMAASSQSYYDALQAERPQLPIYPIALHAVAPASAAAALRVNFIEPGPVCAADCAGPIAADTPSDAVSWCVPGCQVADVAALVQALARELRDHAQVLEGASVTAVTERRAGAAVALASGDVLSFDALVLTPGPWAGAGAWREYTAGLGIRIKKVVALHVERAIGAGDAALLFPQEDAFLVPLRYRGHWLLSYTCTEWDVEPDDLPAGLSAANLADAGALLARYAPALQPQVRSGRVFCDAYSPDREPIVSAVGAGTALIFAGAANGSGYRLAPAIAGAAVQLLS